MLGKNTILKAIHNRKAKKAYMDMVWMLGKNTILKAIHNSRFGSNMQNIGVNAG